MPRIARKPVKGTRVLLYVLMWILCFIFAVPFFWVVSSSLKENAQIFVYPPQWLPNPVKWSNYPRALTVFPFFLYMRNSAIVASASVLAGLLSCTLVGYAFARLRWKGRDLFFLLLLSTMMIPFPVTMIPLFLVYRKLGLTNTYWPLLIPEITGSPYLIFLARQFLRTIPMELSDAAKVDGCSEFRTYWNIILPLCKPLMIVIAIFEFMYAWNDFMAPLIYLSDQKRFTVAVALQLYSSSYQTEWECRWQRLRRC